MQQLLEMDKKEDDLLVDVQKLEPRAIFGLNGKVKSGLHLHPQKTHLVFPLGTKIAIADTQNYTQKFISGHTNTVSCLDVSASGLYIASGQKNHMGFRAYVILWDYYERRELARHDLHKALVQACCFSPNDKYVFSIGGQDDGTVIVFDIETHTPLARTVASRGISGIALNICALNNDPNYFIVAGDRHLRMWSMIREKKKLNVTDINVGKAQRQFICSRVDKRDEFLYLGTMTGDICKASINCCDPINVTAVGSYAAVRGAYGTHNPRKPWGKDCDRYVNGVRDLRIVDDGLLLIGAGDGTVELVEERKDVNELMFKNYPNPTVPMLRTLKKTNVRSAVTSLVPLNAVEFYIATEKNEIYFLNIRNFSLKLLKTCHRKTVYNITFPRNLSTVFATAGYECIRIWSIKRLQELLRIMVYNFHCSAIRFTCDGTSIVSVWNDGIIRAFTPITGRLIYAIPNAHNKGCTALTISTNGKLLVTGGVEGQVRVWKIEPFRQSLIAVLKDHSGPISSLDFNHLDTEVVSAGSDGSCVIWDIKRLCRRQVVTANTQFMCAIFIPSGAQMMTCGSDGHISYWMVYNGSLIRELEGSKKSPVNCLTINKTGDYFVSVGSDQVVRLWDYNRGLVVCEGLHASSVTSATYSPNGKFFVTGSSDGSLIIWDVPEQYCGVEPMLTPVPSPKPSKTKLNVEAKVVSGVKSASGVKENIDGLLGKSPKDEVNCVVCPPINATKKPEVVDCNYLPDIKRC